MLSELQSSSPRSSLPYAGVAAAASRLLLGLAIAGLCAAPTPAQWVEAGCRVLSTATTPTPGDLFGWRVRLVDDVDADGVVDYAVAAPFHLGNLGRISMHSGATGQELWGRSQSVTSGVLGYAMESVDDLNGDGIRDVVASAPQAPNNGVVFFYSGVDGAVLKTMAGARRFDGFGTSIATGGDFNGDGIQDIAIGAVGVDLGSNQAAGRVYVYSSQNYALITSMAPEFGESFFGNGMSFAGDIDGDGRDELVVAARLQLIPPPGRLYVFGYDGTNPRRHYQIEGVDLAGLLDGDRIDAGRDVNGDGIGDIYVGEWHQDRARLFSGVDGSLLRVLSPGTPGATAYGGGMVDDLNADGYDDVMVGAIGNSTGAKAGGQVHTYSGRDGRVLQTMTSTVAAQFFGMDIAMLGDVDGDGGVEFVVTARGTQQIAGKAFVMAGEPCFAGWRNYGSGLAGTMGVPSLTLDADPISGGVATLRVGAVTPTATPGAFVFGGAATALPSPWGGQFLVVPAVVLPVNVPAAGLSQALAVPAGLCGDVFAQVLALDAGAPAGVVETAGLQLHLGR